jgi:hypothetical protein
MDYCASRQERLAAFCKHDKEHTGFTKCGEFCDWPRKYYLKNSSPWS